MGMSDKLRVEGTLNQLELDVGHKWVIALKPITTKKRSLDHQKQSSTSEEDEDQEAYNCSASTPTGEESRIPSLLSCPPAPTKRSTTSPSSSKYYQQNRVMEFFMPPDLESVFVRRM